MGKNILREDSVQAMIEAKRYQQQRENAAGVFANGVG